MLPQRQLEILKLMVEEKTIKEMAELLGISPHTVANTRRKLQEKAKARSGEGIIVWGFRNRLVE